MRGGGGGGLGNKIKGLVGGSLLIPLSSGFSVNPAPYYPKIPIP